MTKRTTFLVRRLIAVILLPVLFACATPLIHPLRVPSSASDEVAKGVVAEAGMSFQVGLGRFGGCDNQEGCQDRDDNSPVFWNIIQFSVGYSHLLWDTLGLMAGLYFPAWENLKDGTWYNTLALWTFATVQNDYFSVGVGPEVGGSGWALTVGAELQPWGIQNWMPALGVYGRVFWPFVYDHVEFDGKERTWEVGGRLRSGMVYLQYTYYTQVSGAMYWTVFETASYAQGMHIISLGISMTRDSFPKGSI